MIRAGSKNTGILVEQIKIVIQNPFVLSKSSEEAVLTSDMLYHPSIKNILPLNKYPYITKDVEIPSKKLYALANQGSQGYALIVEFFFNDEMFTKRLYKYIGDNKSNNKSMKEDDMNKNLRKNLKLMLKLLLPTIFPTKANFITSFNTYIKGISTRNLYLKDSMLYAVQLDGSNDVGFSYLKLNGKIYTVTAVTWVNDIFNHPVYRNFINNFIDYTSWATTTSQSIRQNILITLKSFIDRIYDIKSSTQSLYIFKNIQALEDALANAKKNRSESSRVIVSGEGSKEMFIDNLEKMITLIKNIQGKEAVYKKYITCYNGNNKYLYTTHDRSYLNFTNDENKIFKEQEDLMDEDCRNIFSPSSLIQELFTQIDNIRDYYLKISKFTITGLINFDDRLKKIDREIKDISLLNTIHKFYVNTENVSMFDLDTKDTTELEIKAKLEKSYEQYIKFITSIRTLLKPVRDCNTRLQDSIYNYSKSIESSDPNIVDFNKLMKYIKAKMIYLDDSSLDSDILAKDMNYKESLELNVVSLDKSKTEQPHYEAYVDVDLIEAVLNRSNMNTFNCVYKDMKLGQDLNNMINRTKVFSVTKYNPYTIDNHRITITAEDIAKKQGDTIDITSASSKLPATAPAPTPAAAPNINLSGNKENKNASIPPIPKATTGGKTRRKYKMRRTTRKITNRSRY